MTRFGDLNAIRRGHGGFAAGVGSIESGASDAGWIFPSFIDKSALTQFKTKQPTENIIPSISSKAMRLSLYRGLFAAGRDAFDGIGVSVEWAAAMLTYSAFNAFHPAGFDRDMNVLEGYPRFMEYAGRTVRDGDNLFRICARTARTAENIVKSAVLLASHRGYITVGESALNHYTDLTGIFITRPGVAPKRVGISGYEHWVDFEIDRSIPVLKFTSEPAWLIPGPPRLSREESDHAGRVISGKADQAPGIDDAVELMRMYPGGLPPFEIPIKVRGQGRLGSLSCAETGFNPDPLTACAALVGSGIAMPFVIGRPLMLPMPILSI